MFIVHPGGPFFARRDEGHWSVPKGEIEGGEEAREVARREFEEETGRSVETCTGGSTWLPLGEITQRGGKRVVAWALEGDYDPATMVPGTFQMEWPPRSGRLGEFPELAEVRWFSISAAGEAITAAQIPLLERLLAEL